MQRHIKNILTSKVYEAAVETPLEESRFLSEQTGNRVWLKREDLQPVFSFKLRGAYNAVANLDQNARSRGVIAASAGNHAQGVAFACSRLGIAATIVMPATTPAIKIDAVRSYGAEVVLHGDSYSEAAEECSRLAEERGATFIHPFDDEMVIAGQGTIGDELLRQSSGKIDYLFVPVGGGGLIAGVAIFLKALCPEITIIGVEPVDSDAMTRSLASGKRVELDSVGIFADGVAVRKVGSLTFELCRKYVDEMICVTVDEICSAVKGIFQSTRSIVEPAGALGVAGMRKYVRDKGIQGKNLVAITSGANMNFERLRYVAERTQLGEEREAILAVTIPERPGALKSFCTDLIGDRSITEFNYRLSDRDAAHIFVGIEVQGRDDRLAFIKSLQDQGYACDDLTDNELAKTHIRYMVGGRSEVVHNERLFRFWFPERPGALARFLGSMGENWNISLFHYRTQGGDFGRVLIGLELPDTEERRLRNFLDELGYSYFDESENLAYRLFL